MGFPSGKMLDYLRVSRLKGFFHQTGAFDGILQVFSRCPKLRTRARQLQRTKIIAQALDSRTRIFKLVSARGKPPTHAVPAGQGVQRHAP